MIFTASGKRYLIAKYIDFCNVPKLRQLKNVSEVYEGLSVYIAILNKVLLFSLVFFLTRKHAFYMILTTYRIYFDVPLVGTVNVVYRIDDTGTFSLLHVQYLGTSELLSQS